MFVVFILILLLCHLLRLLCSLRIYTQQHYRATCSHYTVVIVYTFRCPVLLCCLHPTLGLSCHQSLQSSQLLIASINGCIFGLCAFHRHRCCASSFASTSHVSLVGRGIDELLSVRIFCTVGGGASTRLKPWLMSSGMVSSVCIRPRNCVLLPLSQHVVPLFGVHCSPFRPLAFV